MSGTIKDFDYPSEVLAAIEYEKGTEGLYEWSNYAVEVLENHVPDEVLKELIEELIDALD